MDVILGIPISYSGSGKAYLSFDMIITATSHAWVFMV